jgi:uncharacterized protein YjbI with pentapeptide repeats
VAAPDVGTEAATEWSCDGDRDDVELSQLWLRGARVVGVELERPDLRDLRLEECDLGGVLANGFSMRRLELTGTRLRDCVWSGGIVQDAVVEGCTAQGLSLRFTTLQRVIFRDCTLAGLDLYAATFDSVLFERCDLSRAAFDQATVKQLRLTGCNLLGVTGAMSLAGAELDFDDLPALAPSLAREMGLRLME